MRRTTALLPLLVVTALALVGCGPTPPPPIDTPADPRPTVPATATPVPLPSPTVTLPPETLPPLDSTTKILLTTEVVYFCDDVACGFDGFYFEGPSDDAIANLTAVFGFEPTVESYDGSAGSRSWAYTWDDFLLYFSTGGDVPQHLAVQVTAPSIRGVAVETAHNIQVGTPMSEACALAEHTYVGENYEAHFDIIETGENEWKSVIVFGQDSVSNPVVAIIAPAFTGQAPGVFPEC